MTGHGVQRRGDLRQKRPRLHAFILQHGNLNAEIAVEIIKRRFDPRQNLGLRSRQF